MKFLYILCEGERDEMFYERICERITGISFVTPTDLRLRHGSNWKTAMAGARILLARVKHWQAQQDIAIVIAVDNDRAPGHPGATPPPRPLHNPDLQKQPRYPELVEMVQHAVGVDRAQWPVDVALAVPVEMIESWLLLLWNPQRPALPLFAEAKQRSAQLYHGGNAPPQLKDLCDLESKMPCRNHLVTWDENE